MGPNPVKDILWRGMASTFLPGSRTPVAQRDLLGQLANDEALTYVSTSNGESVAMVVKNVPNRSSTIFLYGNAMTLIDTGDVSRTPSVPTCSGSG